MRPQPLLTLLQSVEKQTLYPNEILIIDGSTNDETKEILDKNKFQNIAYHKVSAEDRGLTKQRNYGIALVGESIDFIFFLDDDTVLKVNYFEEIIKTYELHPDALGVGGYICNESIWKEVNKEYLPKINEFCYDNWVTKESSRFILRKILGLDSNVPPGYLPEFSHGRNTGFLPPSGKIYPVEQLMGGVSSFKKTVFKEIQFSTYFDGYGLYEDADFTLRLSKKGPLYINTAAQLYHYHDPSGRPNQYNYGKMVIRNGWYVWRVKYPNPSLSSRIKWNSINMILLLIRFFNIFDNKKKQEAFTETLGRLVGMVTILYDKPIKK